jgi:hypothetical protein
MRVPPAHALRDPRHRRPPAPAAAAAAAALLLLLLLLPCAGEQLAHGLLAHRAHGGIIRYMITNETLLHKNPTTGKPQVIGLGWLDDSMTPHGPTEVSQNVYLLSRRGPVYRRMPAVLTPTATR